MALMIIVNSDCNLHSHFKGTAGKLRYRLPQEALMAIRSEAPSRTHGLGKSSITDAVIESQRKAYIAIHGNDGLES